MSLRRTLRSEDLPAAEGAASGTGERLSAPLVRAEIREAAVGDRVVLLTRLPDGRAVAFGRACPHQGTPLRHATLFQGNLRCPQHSYVYDLESGRNLLPTQRAHPDLLWQLTPGRLEVYRVEERDGWIWVEEEPAAAPPDEPLAAAEEPPGPIWAGIPRRGDGLVPPPPVRPARPPRREPSVERLAARVGEEFELRLRTTAIPGHLWRVEPDGDGIAVLGQRLEAADGEAEFRIRLRGERAGELSVRCLYGRPWDRVPVETRTFVVRLEQPAGGP